MTPAELTTIREVCGLSLPQLAATMGVHERTARYWESGQVRVPDDVVSYVVRLDAQMASAAVESAELLARATDTDVVMIRYRTDADLHRYRVDLRGMSASMHAAMIARVRAALLTKGVDTRIVFMEPSAYDAWRDLRPDNECVQAAWALHQLEGERKRSRPHPSA